MAVIAIGTQPNEPINSGLTRWRLRIWMEAVVESLRKNTNPSVDTRFNLGVENERTDAGRDSRTCRARPKSQAETDRAKCTYPVQLTTSRIGNNAG